MMEPGEIECPDCFIRMHRVVLHGCALYRCMNCVGLWIPEGNLADYAAGRRADTPDAVTHIPDLTFASEQPSIPCPGCESEAFEQGRLGDHRMAQCANCKAVFLPKFTYDFLFPPREMEGGGPTFQIQGN